MRWTDAVDRAAGSELVAYAKQCSVVDAAAAAAATEASNVVASNVPALADAFANIFRWFRLKCTAG